jgi:hypothetical protein
MIETTMTDADYIAAGLTPPKREEPKPTHPVIKGWTPTIGRTLCLDEDVRKAILVLYEIAHHTDIMTPINERKSRHDRRLAMVDALSVEFLGGVPEAVEVLT